MAYPRNSKQQMVDYRVHLNIRSRATEQHSEDILKPREVDREQKEVQPNKFQMQYDTSRNTKNRWSRDLQEELQGKLITKDQELRDLTDKLAQKDQEIDNIRRQWKGAARELGKHQARGKVRDQVTDPELMQKARQLQYNVRNFTCQHFGGELDTGKSFQAACHHLQKNLEVSSAFFDACIRSEVKRPLLVIALLWDFLMNDIFGRFWWGGKRVHIGMDYLTDALESERS